MSTIDETKAAARKVALAARKTVFGTGRDAAAQAHLRAALVALEEPGFGEPGFEGAGIGGAVLAGYMPIRTEIDPVPVMETHTGPVAVPVILAAGQPLAFRRWTADCMLVEGPFGAKIPAQGEDLVPRVVIVPLVGFDARGYRLGYGGGFYDRTLATLRAAGPVLVLGFGFEAQQLPEVPIDAYDQRLDAMVTEAGIRRFS